MVDFFKKCEAFSKYLYFIKLFVKHAMSNFAASSMKTTLSFDNESFAFWLQFQHSEQEFKNLPNSTCPSWKLHNLQISNVQPHNSELYIEPLGKQIYILLTIQLYNCEQHG